MDEQVPAAVIRRDEAKTLVVAEPLDGTRCHVLSTSLLDTSGHVPRPNAGNVARASDARLPVGTDARFKRSAQLLGGRGDLLHVPRSRRPGQPQGVVGVS